MPMGSEFEILLQSVAWGAGAQQEYRRNREQVHVLHFNTSAVGFQHGV